MKDYLPIIERLFYAIAFFFLGWFAKSSTYKPTYLKNDIEVIRDTVFSTIVKEKTNVIYKYITKVDSIKLTINDTVIDSANCMRKNVVILIQDTIIKKLVVLTDTLKSELDTCFSVNTQVVNQNIQLQKQVKKDHRNKAVLSGFLVLISGVFSYLVF